jgi:hypothetical protein
VHPARLESISQLLDAWEGGIISEDFISNRCRHENLLEEVGQ